jgi:hypothetical protein
MLNRVIVSFLVLAAAPIWAQVASTGAEPAATGPSNGGSDAAMLTPAPVSGEAYSMGYASETWSNYLKGGLTFGSAYDDNVLLGTSGKPVSDVSYSIWPSLSLDQTRSRLHWVINYAPGFTFYQKTSSRNEEDQNLALDFKYRLSPHVTLTARDSFLKTSNTLNEPNQDFAQPVSGGVSTPNNSVIAPIADVLSNNANVTITYQFSPNGMVGATGTFTNLHYPTQAQVPGLGDSSSRGGSAFYNHRLSKMHYIGASYEYQMFLAYPTLGQSETQAHSIFLFYTLYVKPTFSFSFFGGPQYSDTQQFGVPASTTWTPAAGASMSWQGRLTSVAASYSRRINDGGGLSGAVKSDTAAASVRRQLMRTLNGAIGANYTSNNNIGAIALLNSTGHTISGNASLQQQVGQHFNLQLQYMRLHQDYSGIQAIASNPDRNRVSATIAYQFSRPLGR